MDKFFTQQTCDRCGGSLSAGRIMSMYNDDCLCLECKEKETQRPDYNKAVEADHAEIRKGNYNFKGIGLKEEVMIDDTVINTNINTDSTMRPVWQLPISGAENRGNAYIHTSAKYHCFVDNHTLCTSYRQNTSFYDYGITVESGYIAQNPNKACRKCYEKWKREYLEKTEGGAV